LVEIVDEDAAEGFGEVARRSRGATQIMQQERDRAAGELPLNLRETIAGRRATQTAQQAERTRDTLTNRAIEPIANRQVVFSPEDATEILADPDLLSGIPGPIRRRLRTALGEATDEEGNIDQPVSLTIREVDNIRRSLGQRAQAPGVGGIFRSLRDSVRDVATEQVPEFGRALQQFANRDEIAQGLAQGREVFNTPVSEFRDIQRFARNPQRGAGQRAGARRALADRAQEGPEQAARLARDLAEDEGETGLQARARTVLPPREADRLTEAASEELTAARRIEDATPRSRPAGGTQTAEAVRDALSAAVVAGGRAGGAFMTETARRLISRFSIPESTAQAMARAVMDPTRTEEVLTMIRRLGANEDEITALFQEAAQAAGITGAVEATEDAQ
jgi:hypothetical protein